jgi:hypothetical protein
MMHELGFFLELPSVSRVASVFSCTSVAGKWWWQICSGASRITARRLSNVSFLVLTSLGDPPAREADPPGRRKQVKVVDTAKTAPNTSILLDTL